MVESVSTHLDLITANALQDTKASFVTITLTTVSPIRVITEDPVSMATIDFNAPVPKVITYS